MIFMKIGIIICFLIIIMLFICVLLYRRQIKKICRQLEFINRNDTNMKLSETEPFSDINGLNEQINTLIEKKQKIDMEARKREEAFKDTITNISHDIRTPLTSLDGYFQLLVQSDSSTEQEKYIAIIKERVMSLNDMLEELFTYTKLQNNKYEFELERIDFGQIVYDTALAFYDEINMRNIDATIDFSEQRYIINGNKEAIRRILQNIIKNAMQHGESKLYLRLFDEDNKVTFQCANDARNIDEIDIAQVFTRFYKADLARTNSSTGLGLSIAKGLVSNIGGEIEAYVENNMFIIRVRFELQC